MNKLTTIAAGVALSLTTTAASALDLEVGFHYPVGAAENGVSISAEVVGFYLSIEAANKVFERSGVDVTFKPNVVSELKFNQWNKDTAIRDTFTAIDSEIYTLPQSHFSIGLSTATINELDGTTNMNSYYDTRDHETTTLYKVAVMSKGVMMPHHTEDGKLAVLAHEIFHVMGAAHNLPTAEAMGWSTDNYGYGHADVCDNGEWSLMGMYSMSLISNFDITGSPTCMSDGINSTVNFINALAPIHASKTPYKNNQTITLSVREDLTNKQYEIIATRTLDISEAITGKLHIASASVDDDPNAMPEIDVFFAENAALSTPILVSFDDIHGLMRKPQPDVLYGGAYAVVVTDKEVQAQTFDFLSVTTGWVHEWPTEDNGGSTGGGTGEGSSGEGSSGEGSSGEGSSGGGGSFGLFGLAFLSLFGWRRRKTRS